MKKKVLIFINAFLPGYKSGGPTQSIANLSQILRERYEVYIVCMNHDTGVSTVYPGIESNVWVFNRKLGLNIYYVSDDKITLKNFKQVLRSNNYNFLYLNSLWNFKFSTLPILAALQTKFTGKIILSPRGELNPGALKLKNIKKRVFKFIFKCFGLHKKIIWNATNQIEKDLIFRHFGSKRTVRLLSNIPKQTQPEHKITPVTGAPIKFIFISRVTPMKNLIFLLERLKKLDKPLCLDIFGPIRNEEYWEKCMTLIEKLPQYVKVRYLGEIPAPEVQSCLQNYHFFVLPTLGENFGHAIFESWLVGKPVIISSRTPWLNLYEKKIGWDIPLENEEEWQSVLEYCSEISQESYQELSVSSWQFAKIYNLNPELRHNIVNLFS